MHFLLYRYHQIFSNTQCNVVNGIQETGTGTEITLFKKKRIEKLIEQIINLIHISINYSVVLEFFTFEKKTPATSNSEPMYDILIVALTFFKQ